MWEKLVLMIIMDGMNHQIFKGGLTGRFGGAIIYTYTGRGNDESSELATPQQKRTEA
jgi:hypothetical protein